MHFVCVEDGTHLTRDDDAVPRRSHDKGMARRVGTVVSDLLCISWDAASRQRARPSAGSSVKLSLSGGTSSHMGIRYKINSSGALEIDGGLTGLSRLPH
jgi:hypothetical protein